jgi:hypothetical protein
MEQDARIQLEKALLPSFFMEEARFVLGLVGTDNWVDQIGGTFKLLPI